MFVFIEAQEDAATGPVGSMLDVTVRDGGRQMLASALQTEIAAYIRRPRRPGRRAVTGSWSVTARCWPGRW